MGFQEHELRFDRITGRTAKWINPKKLQEGHRLAGNKIVRDKLLILRAELQAAAETAEGSAAIVELDQSKVGRLSRMDAMQAQAMAKASAQRRDEALQRVAAALKRIDDDEYGFCLECDEPINPKRLEFDPTVALCIDCASKSENG